MLRENAATASAFRERGFWGAKVDMYECRRDKQENTRRAPVAKSLLEFRVERNCIHIFLAMTAGQDFELWYKIAT